MLPITIYRIRRPDQRRWWKRTHQAEWPECEFAPRAFTAEGIESKAERWYFWDMRGRPLLSLTALEWKAERLIWGVCGRLGVPQP